MKFTLEGSLEKKRERENIFEEIMPEIPNLQKETDSHDQESKKIPNKMNPKKATPRFTIIKMS